MLSKTLDGNPVNQKNLQRPLLYRYCWRLSLLPSLQHSREGVSFEKGRSSRVFGARQDLQELPRLVDLLTKIPRFEPTVPETPPVEISLYSSQQFSQKPRVLAALCAGRKKCEERQLRRSPY